MKFVLRARLLPPAMFGLPDGEKVVIPVGTDDKTTFASPILDTVTGKISGYGTLSEFRKPQDAVDLKKSADQGSIQVRDNFISVTVESETSQEGLDRASGLLDCLCQCLSVQTGQRVSAQRESFEDGGGNLQAAYVRKTVALFSGAAYNLRQLRGQLEGAFDWAMDLDERARKALFYFEHAQLLEEFSKTLPLHSLHAAFSLATAFLQMFKGLVTLVGESGVDSDHQRRAKQLGLGADFWVSRVKPLCKIRNENDVAHYSLQNPDLEDSHRQFSEAAAAFREAFAAYLRSLRRENAAPPEGSRLL